MAGPIPKFDQYPQTTYAAVGHALSMWESMEYALAVLYAHFKGDQHSFDLIEGFGGSGKVFAHRMQALRQAGAAYFVRHPCQVYEGRLVSLIEKATALSETRHQIAHGMVVMSSDTRVVETGYALVAPAYAMNRLWYGRAPYSYTSLDLAVHARSFLEFQREIYAFIREL